MEENELTFNAEKTVAMIFTKRLNFIKPTQKIYGKPIEYVDILKYLNVNLDNKLGWNTHVENQVKKAKEVALTQRLQTIKNNNAKHT